MIFFRRNVTRSIVVNHSGSLQFPRSRLRMENGFAREITGHDVVVRILLENLDVVENVLVASKTLHEPGARVGPVAENLSFNGGFAADFLFRAQDGAPGQIGVRSERVV